MRILDRYLLREISLPWLYSFDAFVLLFMVNTLLGFVNRMARAEATFRDLLEYTIGLLPMVTVQVLPISLLIGVLFGLARLGKHHELQAMRATGVGVSRLAAPLLVAGLLATGVGYAVQELWLVEGQRRAEAKMDEVKKRDEQVRRNFFFTNPPAHRDWYARVFDPRAKRMDTVTVHQQDPTGRTMWELHAERARWTNNTWQFENVAFYQPGAVVPLTRLAATNFPAITESPKLLALEGRDPEELRTSELRRQIKLLRDGGRAAQVPPYLVEWHRRIAFPWANLLVVVLGVPLGLSASRRGPLLGIGFALVLVVAYYLVSNFAVALGSGGHVPAPLAAWFGNGLFAVIGAGLFYWRAH